MDNEFVPSGYVHGDFGEDHLIDLDEVDASYGPGKTRLELAVKNNDLKQVKLTLKYFFYKDELLDMILERRPLRSVIIREFFKNLTIPEIFEIDLVEYLREDGFALSQVVYFRNTKLIKLLLDRGSYIVDDRDDYDGKTALHVAVKIHDLATVKVLVEHGADVDALDKYKKTPLAYLYDQGSDSTGLQILKILLTRATLLADSWGGLKVIGILKFGCKEAVELILQRTGKYLEVPDNTGNTVVHYLMRNRDADAIEALRDRTFDVNARGWYGRTPLQLAAKKHSSRAVELLLAKGADVRIADKWGCSPLLGLIRALQCDSRFEEARGCVQLLLEYGSDACPSSEYFDVVARLHDELTVNGLEAARTLLSVVEPIIARLAVDKARGMKIAGIELQRAWIDYFGMCERQVDRMKLTTVFGSVTLLKFLTESERKIRGYARNEELVSELRRVIENFEANSPYVDLLRKRLLKATRSAELQRKAVSAVGRVVGSKNNAHYLPAEYIVDHLSDRDMENLHFAFGK